YAITLLLERRPPPRSTLCPYTTLFRSGDEAAQVLEHLDALAGARVVEGPLVRGAVDEQDVVVGERVVVPELEHEPARGGLVVLRSEEHTSELQSRENLVCRLLLEKKKV